MNSQIAQVDRPKILERMFSGSSLLLSGLRYFFSFGCEIMKKIPDIKFFIEVCNLTRPFDHIQTSEVCKTPYIPPGL